MGTLRKNNDFLFYMESAARFVNCAEKICMALRARMTRTYFFSQEEEQHGPCLDDASMI